MKGFGYLDRLSLAARWFLPREEAESVIEDYQDILQEAGGPQEARERFGSPVKLVWRLANRNFVRRWHMILVLMLFCLFAPYCMEQLDAVLHNALLPGNGVWYNEFGCSNLAANFISAWIVFFIGIEILDAGSYKQPLRTVLLVWIIWLSFFFFIFMMDGLVYLFQTKIFSGPVRVGQGYVITLFQRANFLFLLGGLASLAAFGWGGKWKKPLSRPLLFSIIGAFVLAAGPAVFCLYSAYGNVYPLAYHLSWVHKGTICLIVLFMAGALISLVLAKTRDARWRSVFILCLAGLAVCDYLYWLTRGDGEFLTVRRDGLIQAFYVAANREIWVSELTWHMCADVGLGTVLAALGLL